MYKKGTQIGFGVAALFFALGAHADYTTVVNCNNGAMLFERYPETNSLGITKDRYQVVIRNVESNGGAGVIRYFISRGIVGFSQNQSGDMIFKSIDAYSYHSITGYEHSDGNFMIEVKPTASSMALNVSSGNKSAYWNFETCRGLAQ